MSDSDTAVATVHWDPFSEEVWIEACGSTWLRCTKSQAVALGELLVSLEEDGLFAPLEDLGGVQ